MSIRPGKYRHYKGNLYEVTGLVRHSETLEELVLYKALYVSEQFPETTFWVRPKSMFTENVTIDGKLQPRFAFVND